MTDRLDNLEPKLLFDYFLALSKIPRGSKHELEAAKWCAEQGRALGLEAKQDAVGNVLISKPGTPGKETRPTVCIQAHVDMVCEKNEGTRHDFMKDPIQVYRDGDLLKARGTTLGADNGIGVAAGLAVLASKDIAHGPVEVLITIDEETGLTGANNLQPNWLKAKYLLNLDSEDEGELTIGCAGGIDTVAKRTLSLTAPKGGSPYRLKVSGLKGGHSGIDINAGRANAIRVLAQELNTLQKDFAFELSSIKGGNKRNAIAREASAVLFLDSSKESAFKAALAKHEAQWKANFGGFDGGITLSLEKGEGDKVMSAEDSRALVGVLIAAPHGVESMSPDIPGLVQTSTNLGVVNTNNGAVEIIFLTRSSIDSSKKALAERISATLDLAGFNWELEGGYPGWKPEPEAALAKTMNKVHKELFNKDMHVVAIHAGLECGLIGEKYPNMEMVSFGPNQKDVHTPDEQVSISSTANFWTLLKGVLEAI